MTSCDFECAYCIGACNPKQTQGEEDDSGLAFRDTCAFFAIAPLPNFRRRQRICRPVRSRRGSYDSRIGDPGKKLEEINSAKKLVRKLPTEAQVADWVDQAKKLPRVISH
jgi:hypothetical protein